MRHARIGGFVVLTLCSCGAEVIVASSPEGGGGGSDADSCGSYADVVEQSPVLFRVQNSRPSPLFVRVACERLPDRAITGANEEVTFDDDPCLTSCEQAQRPQVACDACPFYVLRVEPKGEFTDVWNGLGQRSETMPAACFHDGQGDRCERRIAVPPGEYRVDLAASRTCPDCACDDNGRCTTAEFTGDLDETTSATFDFPRGPDDEVLVVF